MPAPSRSCSESLRGDDPVLPVVHKLQHEFPDRDAQLVICGPSLGANAKVSQLTVLEPLVKHDLLVVSDADVRIPPDLLTNLVASLFPLPSSLFPRDPSPVTPSDTQHASRITPQPGLACCFYRLANPSTLAMRWEAIATNADFWSQVLQSRSLKPMDFALGAVMAVPRLRLEEIGGFKTFVDCLADDYLLGNRIARRGYSIAALSRSRGLLVRANGLGRCLEASVALGAHHPCLPAPALFLQHPEQRHALAPHLDSGKTDPARPWRRSGLLADSNPCSARPASPAERSGPGCWCYAWLVPLKDLLQAAIWLLAFLGNRIEWRGQKLRLRPDGTLQRL